jgi:hypothetical protein
VKVVNCPTEEMKVHLTPDAAHFLATDMADIEVCASREMGLAAHC